MNIIVYLTNWSLTIANPNSMTPYQHFTKSKSTISYVRTYGFKAYILKKSSAIEGILVGYNK